jgi:hypothetical protein
MACTDHHTHGSVTPLDLPCIPSVLLFSYSTIHLIKITGRTALKYSPSPDHISCQLPLPMMPPLAMMLTTTMKL